MNERERVVVQLIYQSLCGSIRHLSIFLSLAIPFSIWSSVFPIGIFLVHPLSERRREVICSLCLGAPKGTRGNASRELFLWVTPGRKLFTFSRTRRAQQIPTISPQMTFPRVWDPGDQRRDLSRDLAKFRGFRTLLPNRIRSFANLLFGPGVGGTAEGRKVPFDLEACRCSKLFSFSFSPKELREDPKILSGGKTIQLGAGKKEDRTRNQGRR